MLLAIKLVEKLVETQTVDSKRRGVTGKQTEAFRQKKQVSIETSVWSSLELWPDKNIIRKRELRRENGM